MVPDERNKSDDGEPFYPDGGYGWIIVGAIIIINISLLTLVPCFGLIFAAEFLEWKVSALQTSFLLHLHSSLYCTFGFFTSPFLKIYGMKRVALVGATLMSLGILFSSYANSYFSLILSTSILIGIGQGIVMPATYLGTYTYFKKRLTIAISLTVTSASLSSMILPKICDILLEKLGRKYTVLTLFFISLFSFIGCFLLKPVGTAKENSNENGKDTIIMIEEINNKAEEADVTKKLLLENNGAVYQATTAPNPLHKSSIWSKLFAVFDLNLLKNIPLVIMLIGLGISFASELNIILMLQFMLEKLSLFNRSEIAYAVSIQSCADIFGRLVIPLIAHFCNSPAKFMYASALVVASLARTILAIWPKEKLVVYIVVVFIGLTKGTRAVFQSVILPKYVSLDKIAAANGINMFFTGCVSLIIGSLIGVVKDLTDSAVYSLHVSSLLSILCVLMWIIEFFFWERLKDKKSNNNIDNTIS